jgi:hypothetical protein
VSGFNKNLGKFSTSFKAISIALNLRLFGAIFAALRLAIAT